MYLNNLHVSKTLFKEIKFTISPIYIYQILNCPGSFINRSFFAKKPPMRGKLANIINNTNWCNFIAFVIKKYTLFFYKNIFYKNIEAKICEILRIF